jgi:hypothetical protein
VQKVAEIEAFGLTPLDYMPQVTPDDATVPLRRDEMAKAAAPYVHPKFAAINHTGEINLGVAARLAAAIARAGQIRIASRWRKRRPSPTAP